MECDECSHCAVMNTSVECGECSHCTVMNTSVECVLQVWSVCVAEK